ncbi:MAG: cytochrome c1 [Pseudomonadota bacterium]
MIKRIKNASLVVSAVVGAIFAVSQPAVAAGGGKALLEANNDVGNTASLQRGARNFMNYCSGCHSAKYVRYNTLGEGLDLSEDQLIENLMFNAEKTFETINVAMRPTDANDWFAQVPPDLSLIARSLGPDHIYTFLKSYYADDKSATGWGNSLKTVSMPHVLWELEGVKVKVAHAADEASTGEDGHSEDQVEYETVVAGQLSADEYDQFVRDTVNFLAFVSEPVQLKRQQYGVWVLAFLLLFGLISYALKKEIWKDVK